MDESRFVHGVASQVGEEVVGIVDECDALNVNGRVDGIGFKAVLALF